MDVTRWIQAAVARLDMAICAVGPWAGFAVVMAGMVWAAIWMARRL